jgi:hypothetical protein
VAREQDVAEAVRKEWIDRFNSGVADLDVLIEYSREKDANRHIGSIKLISILSSRDNWTKATALEVLQRHGFNEKTTIRTLRGSPAQKSSFELIISTSASRWRPRSAVPAGWPWSGKLSMLTANAGAPVPVELLEKQASVVEIPSAPVPAEAHAANDDDAMVATTPSQQTDAERALMDLLGDDEDDDEYYADES